VSNARDYRGLFELAHERYKIRRVTIIRNGLANEFIGLKAKDPTHGRGDVQKGTL
jgi:hypothetical protein